MRACPECLKPILPDKTSCPCGWVDPATLPAYRPSSKGTPVRDPDDAWRCAWLDRGQRCPEPGGISTGTHGGGPWYCRDHIDAVRSGAKRAIGAVPPPRGFQPLRDCLKVAPVPDPEARAERAALQAEGNVLVFPPRNQGR